MNRILFCIFLIASATVDAASYVQPLQCAATGIALNSPSTSATVFCQNVPPPPPANACTDGTLTDAVNASTGKPYSTHCFGPYKLKSGGGIPTTKGPSAYSFSFVFGDSWPGDQFGSTSIFSLDKNQALSIPFTPTPGHTISLNENQTFTLYPITFCVSNAAGKCGNGYPCSGSTCGAGVYCVGTNNPALKLSSNGSTNAQCKLNTNTQYWFTVIPGKKGSNGQWGVGPNGCQTISCGLGVTLYSVN